MKKEVADADEERIEERETQQQRGLSKGAAERWRLFVSAI